MPMYVLYHYSPIFSSDIISGAVLNLDLLV
jgi:hypothetical protein